MEFEFGNFVFKAEIRKASDLKPVLAFPEKLSSDFDAYYMFRDIYKTEEDRERIVSAKIRYDFTVFPPANVGGEFIKTYGHYHPKNSSGVSYPEIYQVIEGKAIFLIQKREGNKIVDCVAIEAEKGDLVLVPPDFGHVTINPTKNTIFTANWVCREFNSMYEPYTNLRGACYYYINGEWIKNKNYGEVPELRYVEPYDTIEDMYELVLEIEKLEFLTKPEKYTEIFKKFLKI